MDWVVVVLAVIIFALIGGMIGAFLTKLIYPTKPIGTLRIDTSDPDGPYLFLELDEGIDKFYKKDFVMLSVNTENYVSQK